MNQRNREFCHQGARQAETECRETISSPSTPHTIKYRKDFSLNGEHCRVAL